MKLFLSISILILSLNQPVYAQNNKDKIEIESSFGGYKYSRNGSDISMGKLVKIMKHDELAYPEIKAAKTKNTMTTILGATGGVLIGIPIGTAIANGKPNWILAGIGAAIIVVSIPISIAGKHQAYRAVEMYNANLTTQSFHKPKPVFRIRFTEIGVGLNLKF